MQRWGSRSTRLLSEADVIYPVQIAGNVRPSTALPQQPGAVFSHRSLVIAFDDQHPVGHRILACPKGCFAGWCPASVLIRNQEMRGTDALSVRKRLRFARQYTAQMWLASGLRREPGGLKTATRTRSARCCNATKAPVHVPQRRHNLLGPLRGMVQAFQIGLGCKDIGLEDCVQDKKLRPRADNGVPATLEKARDREPLLHMFMGVPVEVPGLAALLDIVPCDQRSRPRPTHWHLPGQSLPNRPISAPLQTLPARIASCRQWEASYSLTGHGHSGSRHAPASSTHSLPSGPKPCLCPGTAGVIAP